MSKQFVPASVRSLVYQRDGFRCCYCGGEDSLSVDHVHPESEGGPIDLRNLATCCRQCNSRKGTMPVSEFVNSAWHAYVRSAWGADDYKRLSDRLMDAADWHNDQADMLTDEGIARFSSLPFEAMNREALT
jgi:hypothetical protein